MLVLPLDVNDQSWVRSVMIREWGEERVIVHSEFFMPHLLQGFKAVESGQMVGLITTHLNDDHCEVVTLNAFHPREGIGSALLKKVEETARMDGCPLCRLETTNDNLNALGFYQRQGYHISGIRPGAVDEARKLKPTIPLVAENGIAIRDEITLEKDLLTG